jgi:cyanophycinase-like exopeptidase
MSTPAQAASRGRIALAGSGEYSTKMHDIEGWLLEDRAPRYVQLATAAAPEGERSLQNWWRQGAAAAERLGVEQVIVDVRVREDAENPANAALIEGAGLVYLSGGNPAYLTKALHGTRVWQAIADTWRAGASIGGCSAGAMALGGLVTDWRRAIHHTIDGLALAPDLRVLPHFDRYGRMVPDMALRMLLKDGYTTVGIDEDTALVSDGPDEEGLWPFRSRGVGSSWRLEADRRYRINSALRLRVLE